jgi:hypothetical protein
MNASTLERLLELRGHEELRCRQEFGVAMRAERDAALAQDAARARLERSRLELRKVLERGALPPARYIAWMVDLRVDERALAAAAAEWEARVQARVAAEKTFDSARQAKRSLEKLDEKRRDAKERQARRVEQKALDEVGLRRFRELAEAARGPFEETP